MDESKKYIAVCPHCGSKNVSNDLSKFGKRIGFLRGLKICNECGSKGIFPEVSESELKEEQGKAEKAHYAMRDKIVDETVRNMRIGAPIMLFLGVVLLLVSYMTGFWVVALCCAVYCFPLGFYFSVRSYKGFFETYKNVKKIDKVMMFYWLVGILMWAVIGGLVLLFAG